MEVETYRVASKTPGQRRLFAPSYGAIKFTVEIKINHATRKVACRAVELPDVSYFAAHLNTQVGLHNRFEAIRLTMNHLQNEVHNLTYVDGKTVEDYSDEFQRNYGLSTNVRISTPVYTTANYEALYDTVLHYAPLFAAQFESL